MSEPRKMTKRKCRWCGNEYRAPVGEKWKGCLDCAPQLVKVDREGKRASLAGPV